MNSDCNGFILLITRYGFKTLFMSKNPLLRSPRPDTSRIITIPPSEWLGQTNKPVAPLLAKVASEGDLVDFLFNSPSNEFTAAVIDAANSGTQPLRLMLEMCLNDKSGAEASEFLNRYIDLSMISLRPRLDSETLSLKLNIYDVESSLGMFEVREAMNPEGLHSLCVAVLLSSQKLENLQRCHAPDCDNLYSGPPQKKWCSDKCGTRMRLRKKRKSDKERQML